MSVLIRKGAAVEDRWLILPEEEGTRLPEDGGVLLPLQRWLDEGGNPRRVACGVWLKPQDDPAQLLPDLPTLPVIALGFPVFTDGRAYSQARLLRQRYGFQGELRAIGDVLTFLTTFGHSGPEIWTGTANSWFFDKNKAAFGALADLGIHKADLIHYLLDDEVVEVSSFVATLDKKFPDGSPISVDDNAVSVMRMKGAAIGLHRVSWTFYGQEDNSTRIYGTKGAMRIYDDPRQSLILEKRDGTIERFDLDHITTNAEQTSGNRRSTGVIDAFVESILTDKPSLAEGEEAIKAMRAVFAAAKAAEEGRAVRVEE